MLLYVADLRQGDGHHQVVSSFQVQVAPVEQIQGELQVQNGAVTPCREVAAELAEEQRVGGRARGRGDVSGDLGAAVDPVLNVVTEVSSQIAAVWQDVQGDAREGKKSGDFLEGEKTEELFVHIVKIAHTRLIFKEF